MNCGDGVVFPISEQDRHAIRGLDRQKYARKVGDKRVSFSERSDSGSRGGDPVHHIRMNLLDCGEARSVGSNRLEKSLAVQQDAPSSVTLREAEIQNLAGSFASLPRLASFDAICCLKLACAAVVGTEGVDEPVQFCQGRRFEDLQASHRAEFPAVLGQRRMTITSRLWLAFFRHSYDHVVWPRPTAHLTQVLWSLQGTQL